MGSHVLLACKIHTYREQVVDNYEYELPENFEDEEIDEDAAFNEEDEKLYGDWFSSTAKAAPDGDESDDKRGSPDLLDSEEENERGREQYDTDDFSEEVSLIHILTQHTLPGGPLAIPSYWSIIIRDLLLMDPGLLCLRCRALQVQALRLWIRKDLSVERTLSSCCCTGRYWTKQETSR
jgi:hypothetical protein